MTVDDRISKRKKWKKEKAAGDKRQYVYRQYHLQTMLSKESISNCSSLPKDIKDRSFSFPVSYSWVRIIKDYTLDQKVHDQPTIMCGTNVHIERSRTRESMSQSEAANVTHPAGYSRPIDPAGYESTLRDVDHPKTSPMFPFTINWKKRRCERRWKKEGRCPWCPDFHEDVSETSAAWKRRKEVPSTTLSDGTIALISRDNIGNIFPVKLKNITFVKKLWESI